MRYKSHIIASIGTALFMLLLFLLLWMVYIDRYEKPEDEGIMVSFGDADMGEGAALEPTMAAVPEIVSPPATQQQPSSNNLMTQDTEESLALAKQQEEEKQKQKEEQERQIKQKEKEEADRAEAERIAKEKAIAEQKAKQAAIDKANNLMGGAFSSNTSSSSGSGNTHGDTMQGNPVGKGTSNGHGWSLSGRSLKGNLVTPSAKGVQEGVVVISIRVDAAGKVIDAKQGNGTTISEKQTIQACIDASRKAVFSAGNNVVVGSITYKFKNK